jgi:phosphatidylserine/phosphatidylglycerophosphate/cardiolipin synthase-like enzyme
MPWGKAHGPRHEVMAMLEGPVASALGDIVRRRWARANGELLERPKLPPDGEDYWPPQVGVDLVDVEVGVARTEPDWRDHPEVRESERLHLAGIASARRLIYLENQYVTAPIYAEALAARLAEPEGPEVVIISTARAPSWFDHLTMDRTRSTFLATLRAADRHGRFHAYCPYTRGGAQSIIIHSKVAIIDDRLLRAGSTNLNNRSAGFDTECDVAAEAGAGDQATQGAIRRFRARLLAHYLGCSADAFEAAHQATGSLAGAVEALDVAEPRRLRPLSPHPLGPLSAVIAAFHLGDPVDVADAWRPWRRRADIEAERRAFLADLRTAAAERKPSDSPPRETVEA